MSVVKGVTPPPCLIGTDFYHLIDGNGTTLATGRAYIPKYIYHDKADRSGRFTGFRQTVDGPVTFTLPYFEDAETLEIYGLNNELLLQEDLRRTSIRIIEPAIAKPLESSNLGEYLRTLEPVMRTPWDKDLSARKPEPPSPTSIAVAGSISVTGVTDSDLLWTYISFYNHADGSYVKSVIIDSTDKFTVYLDPGRYLVKATCWYDDPAFNWQYVPLYPYYLTTLSFVVSSTTPAELALKWDLNYLFRGMVKSAKGVPLEAKIYVLEKRFSGSTFQTGIAGWLDTKANGSFGMRLPVMKFAFAVIPRGQDVAGEMLAVKQVKRQSKPVDFICENAGNVSGAALKRIYGSGDTAGKLNLLFLAEAYTSNNEKFVDKNGNGRWDGDLLLDENGNGSLDAGEYYYDRNENERYDPPEPFKDRNGDRICNRYERAQFEFDCAVNTAELLNCSPFSNDAQRINAFSYWLPSVQGTQSFTGIAKPWHMNTALGVSCNSTGYMQIGIVDSNLVKTIAAAALPDYTIPIVMVHDPFNVMRANAMYGFGRILLSAEDSRGGTVLLHELGHSFGNLADEYVYDDKVGVSYPGGEPGQANITTVTDPSRVKWSNLIKGNPPVPTPFGYEGYGIFEGAGPGSYGVYRPTATSMMRETRYPFFKVNEAQLIRVLTQFHK